MAVTTNPLELETATADARLRPLYARPASAAERSAEAVRVLREAEAAADAHRFEETLQLLEEIDELVRSSPPLRFRALLARSWALMSTGDAEAADQLLEQAGWMAASPDFTDIDRAEVLYRLGCCRLRQSRVGNATALLTVALEDAQRSDRPAVELQASILQWRARCWLRQNLSDMAQQDVDLALELIAGGSPRIAADVSFQASIVSERRGNWLLARMHAEGALEAYRRLEDGIATNKVLNNLGCIHFLLGDHDAAIDCLTESLAIARSLGDPVGTGFALSTLAETLLRTGDAEAAEDVAGQALTFLESPGAALTEAGCALLTLGRATAAQGRLQDAAAAFQRADRCFQKASSSAHQAEAWIAQGELAEELGDMADAARRYRRAAVALRTIHL